jgi:hypothetical protein
VFLFFDACHNRVRCLHCPTTNRAFLHVSAFLRSKFPRLCRLLGQVIMHMHIAPYSRIANTMLFASQCYKYFVHHQLYDLYTFSALMQQLLRPGRQHINCCWCRCTCAFLLCIQCSFCRRRRIPLVCHASKRSSRCGSIRRLLGQK